MLSTLFPAPVPKERTTTYPPSVRGPPHARRHGSPVSRNLIRDAKMMAGGPKTAVKVTRPDNLVPDVLETAMQGTFFRHTREEGWPRTVVILAYGRKHDYVPRTSEIFNRYPLDQCRNEPIPFATQSDIDLERSMGS